MALSDGLLYTPSMPSALYTRDILRLAASIPHHRRLADPHGSAEKRSAVCGSRVVVDVVTDEQGRIAQIGQEVSACALGQASAALMGAAVIGRDVEALAQARDVLAGWLRGDRSEPGEWPGLDALAAARDYPARHAAILLPFEAAVEAAALAARVEAA